MLRAIFRRRMRDSVSGCQVDNQLFSIRVDVPAIENELRRGGFGEAGYEVIELVGIEIERPEDNPYQVTAEENDAAHGAWVQAQKEGWG